MGRANPWRWHTVSADVALRPLEVRLLDGHGRHRASVWRNDASRFTWHTYDDRGTGGENAEARSLNDAKDRAMAAIVRQGWAPGGWKVQW